MGQVFGPLPFPGQPSCRPASFAATSPVAAAAAATSATNASSDSAAATANRHECWRTGARHGLRSLAMHRFFSGRRSLLVRRVTRGPVALRRGGPGTQPRGCRRSCGPVLLSLRLVREITPPWRVGGRGGAGGAIAERLVTPCVGPTHPCANCGRCSSAVTTSGSVTSSQTLTSPEAGLAAEACSCARTRRGFSLLRLMTSAEAGLAAEACSCARTRRGFSLLRLLPIAAGCRECTAAIWALASCGAPLRRWLAEHHRCFAPRRLPLLGRRRFRRQFLRPLLLILDVLYKLCQVFVAAPRGIAVGSQVLQGQHRQQAEIPCDINP
mmetsp:Transcript_1774/g.6277  ORF Transcript_1774/g.6277 Transcript_1774/m.6277 type:complete len:325 (-) Transcript_1774:249-1223(-)